MPVSVSDIQCAPALAPEVFHKGLATTFNGIEPVPDAGAHSASDARVHQYLGIQYATIPARFRQSRLCTVYPPVVDASKHGPICPQPNHSKTTEELLFGILPEAIPVQDLKQDESLCLNLNITCPAGLTPRSRVPVMLWVHGGGDRGSGSDWMYDGANLVRKSMDYDKPVILVSFNFRLGLLGFAASAPLRDDNAAAGDEGVGNYGLRDQRVAMEWIHRYIGEFGGDPHNITLFGSGSGAADIMCHVLSRDNETQPLFQRAIIQSAVFEPILPDVSNAGWQLSRIMSALQVTNVDKFRNIEVQKLLGLGQTIRVVDDGCFFREGWQTYFHIDPPHAPHQQHRTPTPSGSMTSQSSERQSRTGRTGGVSGVMGALGGRAGGLSPPPRTRIVGAGLHPPASAAGRSRSKSALRSLRSRSRSRLAAAELLAPYTSRQPLIIGDNCCDSLLWSLPTSLWTSAGVVRRLKAICQSLSKTSNLLRYYDLSSSTPDHEVIERVLELVNDARIAWPTQVLAESARRDRGMRNVWRYVFDQEGPARGMPHHAADLMYLFDNAPLPAHMLNTSGDEGEEENPDGLTADGCYFDVSDEEDGTVPKYDPVQFRTSNGMGAMFGGSPIPEEDEWCISVVDEYSYLKVKDSIQERWISFAHGEMPWKEEKIFVFGPEGETGERSRDIFEGRRRKGIWKEVFEPLGMQLVQKVGVELSRGPAPGHV